MRARKNNGYQVCPFTPKDDEILEKHYGMICTNRLNKRVYRRKVKARKALEEA